ncbi:MAG TPA: hypothetical protein VFA18_08030 [Gemmataceae bacterium]|nr:hypothetical protein [Gemmataceae bacterium]
MLRALACLLALALLCGPSVARDKKPKNDHKPKTKKSSKKKNNNDKNKNAQQHHSVSNPANAAKIKQLREEIHHLRHQEHVMQANIDARYRRILAKLDAPEDQLEAERNRLRRERDAIIRDLPPGPQRHQLRLEYDELIRLLNKGIRHDEAHMDHIRRIRASEKRHVRAAFDAKIHELEHEIRALEKSGGPRPLTTHGK